MIGSFGVDRRGRSGHFPVVGVDLVESALLELLDAIRFSQALTVKQKGAQFTAV